MRYQRAILLRGKYQGKKILGKEQKPVFSHFSDINGNVGYYGEVYVTPYAIEGHEVVCSQDEVELLGGEENFVEDPPIIPFQQWEKENP